MRLRSPCDYGRELEAGAHALLPLKLHHVECMVHIIKVRSPSSVWSECLEMELNKEDVTSGVAPRSPNIHTVLFSSFYHVRNLKFDTTRRVFRETQKLKVAQLAMKYKAYYAYPSIRDHWAQRCMSRRPDQVVSLKRDVSPQ
ncbi:hypothetical protein TNCV_165591 [Trichonephila clavipes]|nr:hypothetical protein TNCV_165591 [Trichonephila clavipes]